jgi:hypothetical protein
MGDEIENIYIQRQKPITIFLKFKILLCQNSGIIFGVAIMYLLAKYSTHLEDLVQV